MQSQSHTTQPHVTLNNGVVMPALGFGVFQTPPEATVAAVDTALATGYRHIDTAAAYLNEREVGEGLRRSGIDRAEVFIETKVWISDYGYEQTLHAFDKSRRKLGVDQIDLLLLHQPLTSAFDKTVAAYKALEKLLADGSVRAIGVSNFMPDRLEPCSLCFPGADGPQNCGLVYLIQSDSEMREQFAAQRAQRRGAAAR
ncbi:MAG: aldo/keto reductase [Candidatus Nanopelagicales bacterium]